MRSIFDRISHVQTPFRSLLRRGEKGGHYRIGVQPMMPWLPLVMCLYICFKIGFWVGRYSVRTHPDLSRLSDAQRRQVENAIEDRMPFWPRAVGILIACVGCPLVIGVFVAGVSPLLQGVVFFIWIGATLPSAVICIRSSGRIMREELECMNQRAV
jgi:hypothetical protein